MNRTIPPALRQFVHDEIHSLEQLEILLHLHANPTKIWTAESVAKELRLSPLSTGARLVQLSEQGLLRELVDGQKSYKYDPATTAQREAVDMLASAHAEQRFSIIELIFSKPVQNVMTFANAFRVRKGD